MGQARSVLETLREAIERLCARGLGQLDDEDQRAEQAELAPRLAAAAVALSELLGGIAAQREGRPAARAAGPEPGAPPEPSRISRLGEALQRYGAELPRLAAQPLSERQRLLAAGMRLCAAVALELGATSPGSSTARGASREAGRGSAMIAPAAVSTGPVQPRTADQALAESVPAAKSATAPRAVRQATTAPRSVRQAVPEPPTPASKPEGKAALTADFTADSASPLLQPLGGHPGIGPSTAEKLAARGLSRVIDALYFLPRRWDDLRQLVPVGALQPGVLQSTVVVVERSRVVWARRRFLEAMFRGEDGEPLLARWFYFVGGMQRRLQPGARFVLTATPVRFRNALQVVHPELTDLGAAEPMAEGSAAAGRKNAELGRVRVCYPEVDGVPPRTVERLCQSLCERYADQVPDGIPQALLHKLSLPALPRALRALHLSSTELPPEELERLNQGLAPAQRRLIFEELFFLQLGLCQRRRSARVETATPCRSRPEDLMPLRAALPFVPTGAQERAIAELQRDLAQPHPMQRLLHGDVGSGKTLVAYAACEIVMAAGHQAAFMAPTEILAEQHKKTLQTWALATGRRIALLTATTPKTARKTTLALLQAGRFADVWRLLNESQQELDRETILAMLAAGFLHLVIGTHALLAERVEFADLGLVVIDEQHRFGVAQRAALRKKGVMPHLLVMTATPIPRTLALTLYGDLDVTQLDELPPGRTPPLTRVLAGKAGQERAVAALRRAVSIGRQAFWVCPLIEESDKIDLANATARHADLVTALPECQVGLLHGRMNTDERDEVMERFRSGTLHILVATTVIEVGVDVPNASLMVIESAERFGLAQLHQLRGRIGRGAGPSACLLLHHGSTETQEEKEAEDDSGAKDDSGARKEGRGARETKRDKGGAAGDSTGGTPAGARLSVLARTSNGFHIAEADLRIRGPGEVLGTRQAGLPPLRYADLLRDLDLLQIARREAAALLTRDPDLGRPEHALMKRVLSERWASADMTLE